MLTRPEISSIQRTDADGNPREYVVGRGGITKIQETQENGEYAFYAWVEVWAGDELFARFPQNKLDAIFY